MIRQDLGTVFVGPGEEQQELLKLLTEIRESLYLRECRYPAEGTDAKRLVITVELVE